MSVIKDIIEGDVVTRDRDGFTHRRYYIIDELTGEGAARKYNAILTPGVPVYGEAHPHIPGIVAVTFSAESIDSELARIVIGYKTPDVFDDEPDESSAGVIRVGGSVQSTKTQFDKDGNQIVLTHNGVSQGGEIEIMIPQMVLGLERRESFSPAAKSRRFQGTVNNAPIWGYGARELLCIRLEGTSTDGGVTYVVNYEFQYNPDKWDGSAIFIDSESGRPPVDVVEGEGVKTVRRYPEESFNQIGISF